MSMDNYHLTNVLLIEDDSEDVLLFAYALMQVSPESRLTSASTCDEAFYLLPADYIPDVIFLDFYLPKINGMQCIQLLKNHVYLKGIPIVVMSATIPSADIDKLYKLGVSYFIQKPPTMDKLKAVLDKIVNTPHVFEERTRDNFFVNQYEMLY